MTGNDNRRCHRAREEDGHKAIGTQKLYVCEGKLAAEMCTEHTGGCDGCVFNNVAVWNGCMFRQKKYPARWHLNMED